MEPYSLTYFDFSKINPASTIETIFFIVLLSLMTFSFLYFIFFTKKISLEKRENTFFLVSKYMILIYILLILRAQLMHLYQASQYDTFMELEIVFSLYSFISSFGQLTYELVLILILLIIFKIIFFYKKK